jgi:uncharacterized protein YndB with AHSA1/START domain
MSAYPHFLERQVLIRATPETVFGFFTDSARFADWWGPGSAIDGRPGGRVKICYPGAVTASGAVVELTPYTRVVFTYGYDDPAKPIPPGGSLVTITLEERRDGTLVTLRHELADAATRDQHVQGWRYQMALFAVAAARAQHAGVAAVVDRYFAAWNEPDVARRTELLAVTTDDVTFRDAFGCTAGREDLATHISAVLMFMPGMTLARRGEVRQMQGGALGEWVATGPDGQPRGEGTNAFELGPDGRIASVVGFGKA